jgi:CBS domain-containing protein
MPGKRRIETLLKEVKIGQLHLAEPCRVEPDTILGDVCRLLGTRRIGGVLVCEAERLVGIFTDRDVLYRTALEGTSPKTPIEEVMTRRAVTLSPDQPLAAAVEPMCRCHCRHVPLVDAEERATGLVTSRDVLSFIAESFPKTFVNFPPVLHQRLLRPEGG